MSEGREKRIWEQETHRYGLLHPRLKLVVDEVRRLPGRKVLDIGCSTGMIGASLGSDYEYFGVDIAETAGGDWAEGAYVTCNLNEEPLPFTDEKFPIITCSGILEYISDLPRFIDEVRGRLTPDGAFVLTYFNMNHVSRIRRLLVNRSFPVHPLWRNFHSPGEFKKLLVQGGLHVETERALNLSWKPSQPVERTPTFMAGTTALRFLWPLFAHQIVFTARPN